MGPANGRVKAYTSREHGLEYSMAAFNARSAMCKRISDYARIWERERVREGGCVSYRVSFNFAAGAWARRDCARGDVKG